MSAKDRLKADLKRLGATGAGLVNAMNVEQFPERMESHFREVLKKDFTEFVKGLPVFHNTYQAWYSEAQAVIRRFLPGRLMDFANLYEASKGRKEIRQDNYVIEDYLKNIMVTAGFDKKIVASPPDAIPLMQQQLNILNAVYTTFDSTLLESTQILQSELLDAELRSARELAKNHFLRSAGAIGGIVLEKHFEQLVRRHELKLSRKSPTIKEYNELFSRNGIYEFSDFRLIQYLGEIHHLCCKNKKEMPTEQEVEDLLNSAEKVIKTIF
ncbi:hypothetical protein ABIC45_002969 [Mucilaginibacter rubeus]|uniref:hypothetical protein n=1 Tax=Mucilaginibacter rubeus TaxID=2027860 RepID=UPI003395B11A